MWRNNEFIETLKYVKKTLKRDRYTYRSRLIRLPSCASPNHLNVKINQIFYWNTWFTEAGNGGGIKRNRYFLEVHTQHSIVRLFFAGGSLSPPNKFAIYRDIFFVTQVKAQLANKAIKAAQAAEAALAGKAAVVGQLQREMKEAETVIQEETISLQRMQTNANAAEQAAKQAQQQVKTPRFADAAAHCIR